MTMGPQESVCLAHPLARITVTVPIVPGGANALVANEIDGGL